MQWPDIYRSIKYEETVTAFEFVPDVDESFYTTLKDKSLESSFY